MTLLSTVNLQAIDFGALFGAYVVTEYLRMEGNETLVVYRVVLHRGQVSSPHTAARGQYDKAGLEGVVRKRLQNAMVAAS